MLIGKGAQLDSQDNGGITALRIAIDERLTDCVRLLTQHGSNVSIQVVDHIFINYNLNI